jgi:hypothetical protein
MPNAPKEDITTRLAMAALDPSEVDPSDLGALLREAIITIETLRVRADDWHLMLRDDIEPEGNA